VSVRAATGAGTDGMPHDVASSEIRSPIASVEPGAVAPENSHPVAAPP
jgi:hypothetical protein